MRKVIVVLVVIALTITGTGVALAKFKFTPRTRDSGIYGQVVLGPTCPVQYAPPKPSCSNKPYAAKLKLVANGTSNVVKTFTSDSNGNFRVSVRAGTYQVKSASTGFPVCSSNGSVEVQPHVFTQIDVACDTGIR